METDCQRHGPKGWPDPIRDVLGGTPSRYGLDNAQCRVLVDQFRPGSRKDMHSVPLYAGRRPSDGVKPRRRYVRPHDIRWALVAHTRITSRLSHSLRPIPYGPDGQKSGKLFEPGPSPGPTCHRMCSTRVIVRTCQTRRKSGGRCAVQCFVDRAAS
jgi:hypothetical protein